LDPLKVKDQMGRLGGKMKNQFNKISEKIPLSKKSSDDDFDKVVLGIGQEVKKNELEQLCTQNKDKEDGHLQQQQQESHLQELELDSPELEPEEHQRLSKVVQKMTDVKGKLNKLGRAAKSRLVSFQPNSSFGHEENDSAHSSASKDSNNSLTATARLSRSLPSLFPTAAIATASASPSPPLDTLPSRLLPSAGAGPASPSTGVAEELLELWNDDIEKELAPDNGGDGAETDKPPRLSRRPSEYLEFEKCSSPEESPAGEGSGAGTPAVAQGVTVSHTPFLYPKVKKMSFLKNSSSTPPLETPDLEEPDPYYQPYPHHSHPPSLSKSLT
jgi:hypothetical protein